MKTVIKYFLILVLGLLVGAYLVPTPKHTIAELYKGEAKSIIDSLETFRKIPTQTLELNGQSWKYLIEGNGEETIVFLHGMAGSYDFWWQQINAFKDQYRIVSVTYPPVNSLSEMGNAIIAILNQNKIEKVNIVGSSLGGYFAQYLLATYPNRIKKAVFGNTFPPNELLEKQNPKMITLAKIVPEWLMMYFLRQGLYKNVIPAAQNDPLTAATLLENTYGKMSKAQFIARYNCVVDKFKPIYSSQNKVPILIFEADNDPLVPLELRKNLKQWYPSAQVYNFHNKGHFPYLNSKEEYNRILRAFLEQP